MTQVDRAIAALLEAWLSPRQLSAVSGRVNPNGLIRDARAEAARRGLVWREVWVRNEWGKRYKMHHLERSESLARPARPGGVTVLVGSGGRSSGYAPDHERVSSRTPSNSPDTLAGDPQEGEEGSAAGPGHYRNNPDSGQQGPAVCEVTATRGNPRSGNGSQGQGRPSSPSRWRNEVGVGANAQRVSGAARATGGATRRADEGRLF